MKKIYKNLLVFNFAAISTFSIGLSTKIEYRFHKRTFEDITKKPQNIDIMHYASDFKNSEIIYSTEHNGNYFLDKQYKGGSLSLKVNDKIEEFTKGIGVHAGCTLIFDLRPYTYDKFSTIYGMDTKQTASTGAKISFFATDATDLVHATWQDLEIDPQIYRYNTNARKISLDIKNKKFLKIKIDSLPNSSNSYNHINFARAIFHKNSFDYDNFKEPIFSDLVALFPYVKSPQLYANDLATVENISDYSTVHANNLYQNMFVSNIGYANLLQLIASNNAYKEAAHWLFHDNEAMELLMTGGNLENNNNEVGWKRVFENLANLYYRYKDDLQNNTIDPETNVRLGFVFKKMLISIALTHTNNTPNYGYRDYWGTPNVFSDKYFRYETFKNLRLENDELDQKEYLNELRNIPEAQRTKEQKNHLKKLEEQIASNDYHCKLNKVVFDKLPVEYMRWVFHGLYSDSEIKWFNYFSRRKKGFNGQFSIGGYEFMNYTQPDAHNKFFDKYNLYNPSDPKAIAKFAEMDKKYKLSKFGIPNDGRFRFWAAVEVGQVCGGISKHGVGMLTSTGHPASVIGQPGHGAYLNYSFNNNNKAIWRIDNNVGGWLVAEKGERMPLDWVKKSISEINVNYITLTSRALENFESYVKSEFWVKLITYNINNDLSKKEKFLENALLINQYNYNAWNLLIDLYKESSKTVEDKKILAKRILVALKNYPVVYRDLINKLLKDETNSILKFEVNSELKSKLEEDTIVQDHDTFYHSHITREQAKGILNGTNVPLASFSFSGEHANKIMINEIYKNSNNTYRYSIDGGNTFIQTQENEIVLTEEQIANVCNSCGIIVGIMGSDKNYKIGILNQHINQDDYVPNFNEGNLSGDKSNLSWSLDKVQWFKFSDADLRVDKKTKIYIKKESIDNKAESNILTYVVDKTSIKEYKEDIYLPSNKYEGLASSDETNSKNLSMKHLFDGDETTAWHTNYHQENQNKYIIWNFKESIDISKLQYIPYKIEHVILQGKIYVSNEEQKPSNWKEFGQFNWERNLESKYIYFDTNTLIKHLKIEITKTSNHNSKHASARGFNVWIRNNEQSRISSNRIVISTNSEEKTKSNDSIQNALNDSNAIWHTKWDKSIKNPYVFFEFDEVKKITKIKYTPRQDVSSGFIKNAKVLVSKDGLNFEEIISELNWENNNQTKEIIFTSPIEAKFIKLIEIEGYDQHVAAKKFEIYEFIKNNQIIPSPSPKPIDPQNKDQKNHETNITPIIIGSLVSFGVLAIGITLLSYFIYKKRSSKK